jgi:hypothetical protein
MDAAIRVIAGTVFAAATVCACERRAAPNAAIGVTQQAGGQPSRQHGITELKFSTSVWCDGFADDGHGNYVPSSDPGSVLVQLADSGSAINCAMTGIDGDLDEPPPPGPWSATWWEYLRGIWPTHRAGRIVAGTGAKQKEAKGSMSAGWTVVFQIYTRQDGQRIERVYCVDSAANPTDTLQVWLVGHEDQSLQLGVGDFAEVQNNILVANPPPSSPEAGAFESRVKALAMRKHLPEGVK